MWTTASQAVRDWLGGGRRRRVDRLRHRFGADRLRLVGDADAEQPATTAIAETTAPPVTIAQPRRGTSSRRRQRPARHWARSRFSAPWRIGFST